jgi:hypothetical protein
MHRVRTLVALVLIPCLAGSAGAAVAGNGAKKGKNIVHGQVVSVQMDAGKSTGTITIQVHKHKKADAGTAPVEKTFKLSAGTKVEIVKGKKGAVTQNAADLSAVQKGQHVFIHFSGNDVSDVKIVKKGKGKDKTT